MGYVTITRIAGYVGILYLETEMYQQLFRVEHFYFDVIRTRLGILAIVTRLKLKCQFNCSICVINEQNNTTSLLTSCCPVN